MKQIIMDVLDDMSDSQINLASYAARETVSSLISAALKTKGTYTEYGDYELDEQEARASWVCSICGENTFEVDYDYIGSGTNHLECEIKSWDKIKDHINEKDDSDIPEGLKRAKELSQEAIKEGIQKQAYLEMTSDGLPEGGDVQAVLESHKLAEQIVEAQEGTWIYESPDGGKTVFRRPFADYDPKNKEEIDWETKEPTGRKFTEYNNENWNNKKGE